MNNSFNDTIENQVFQIAQDSGIEGLEVYDFMTGTFEQIEISDGAFELSFEKSESKYLKITGNVNRGLI